MPRYFLHLKDGVSEVLDPEGVELSPDAVPLAATRAARDCIAGDVLQGRLDLHFRIEVRDESGRIVHSLPFKDALEEVPAR